MIRFYNQGGKDPHAAGLSLDIRPLNLTDSDQAALVSFLESLTSAVVVTPPGR